MKSTFDNASSKTAASMPTFPAAKKGGGGGGGGGNGICNTSFQRELRQERTYIDKTD